VVGGCDWWRERGLRGGIKCGVVAGMGRAFPGLRSETWGTHGLWLGWCAKGNSGSFDSRWSLRMTVLCLGSCFPTLAAKTTTRRGWGTRARKQGSVVSLWCWVGLFSRPNKLGRGPHFLA
jgi:hypothetical protein